LVGTQQDGHWVGTDGKEWLVMEYETQEPDSRSTGAADAAERASEPEEVMAAEDVLDADDVLDAEGHPVPDEMPAWEGEPGRAGVRLAGTERPTTGEPRVDEVLRGLDELAELPVSEHPAVFEHLHARLREVLDELDSGRPEGALGHRGG
jgi:hypothetical protein